MYKNYIFYLLLFMSAIFLNAEASLVVGFSGGPGVGKSTVIGILKSKGFGVVPETFTSLFNQAKSADKLADLFKDPLILRQMLMQRQLESEDNRDKAKVTFVDETALGILFFGNKFGVAMPEDLYYKGENRRYDIICIFLPLTKDKYIETDVRQENYEQSLEIHEFLKDKYQKTGLNIIYVPFDTPEVRAQFILDSIEQQYKYKQLIKDVINCFINKESIYNAIEFLPNIKLIEITKEDGTIYRFFGIHKDQQEKVNFAELKKKITKIMGIKMTYAIQVIGDSNQFSAQGTFWAREFLNKKLANNGLIEYGFTGYKTAYKSDVNTLVSDFIKQNPDQAFRVLANIVGQTMTALESWGTSGSDKVRNFILIYNDYGLVDLPKYNANFDKISGFTTFGDDIITSDHLLSKTDGDKFICLEGGAQSFRQVANALINDISIEFVTNLRKTENEAFFSTAKFFYLISDLLKQIPTPRIEDVKAIYTDYVKTLKSLWDSTRPDYETKKALFEKAIAQFIDNGLYKKIPMLCTFKNSKLDKAS